MSAKCLDVKNKVYSIALGDLTYGDLKEMKQLNNVKLGSLLMFYSETEDEIYVIEGDHYLNTLKLIQKSLQKTSYEISRKIPQFKVESNRQVLKVMQRVLEQREKMQPEIPIPNNPNSRFISVGDNVIQINKIISVKKYSDTSIDILTTGRNASVRKTYPNCLIRDSELSRLKKILLEIS